MSKRKNTLLLTILLTALAGGNVGAQGISKWKYIPNSLVKQPKIPAVINPALSPATRERLARLDLQFEVNFARAKAQWQAEQLAAQQAAQLAQVAAVKAQTLSNIPTVCPPQFADFAAWMDQLAGKNLIANRYASQALHNVRKAITAYDTLSPQQQAQVNLLVITLSQFRTTKLGAFGLDYYKIAYHPSAEKEPLPQPEGFHLQLELKGILKYKPHARWALAQHVNSLSLAENYKFPDKIAGLTLYQGFQPQKASQELEHILARLTPPGYTVRISTHELGLSNNYQKFRQGSLHLHFEKINARPGLIPTDISIELWISAIPYAGIIDPKTRKIIVPFSDKKIAQNYLILFDKYLTPHARRALQNIAD